MSATLPTRVAVITGASQGMGEAIALRLAADGLDIVLNDIPAKADQLAAVVKQVEAKGRRALAVPGDASDEATVKALVDAAVAKFGSVDVMVANAGIVLYKPVLETSMEDLDRVMNINFRGVMLAYKYAATQMIRQGRGGRIIGACSGSGKRGVLNMSAYSASKFAVRGFTQACAQEWAKHKITVNSYAPGAILTPMLLHPDDDKNGGPASTIKLAAGMPLDMPFAQPSVVADLVSYLANPATWFVTGQSINIDGGLFMD